MDGDHLHCLGIGLEAPGPLLVLGVPGGIMDAPAEPGGHGGRSEALGDARLVQQLGDVAQVRHETFARGTCQHPLGHPVRATHRLEERGDALVAQQ